MRFALCRRYSACGVLAGVAPLSAYLARLWGRLLAALLLVPPCL